MQRKGNYFTVEKLELKQNFSQTPNEIYKLKSLKSTEKIILMYLISNSNTFRVTNYRIGVDCSIHKNTVKKAVNKLYEIGYIIKTADHRIKINLDLIINHSKNGYKIVPNRDKNVPNDNRDKIVPNIGTKLYPHRDKIIPNIGTKLYHTNTNQDQIQNKTNTKENQENLKNDLEVDNVEEISLKKNDQNNNTTPNKKYNLSEYYCQYFTNNNSNYFKDLFLKMRREFNIQIKVLEQYALLTILFENDQIKK
jgi:hypothetical protein